jgi:hypothetical protein
LRRLGLLCADPFAVSEDIRIRKHGIQWERAAELFDIGGVVASFAPVEQIQEEEKSEQGKVEIYDQGQDPREIHRMMVPHKARIGNKGA